MRKVVKIVTFYDDGTFEESTPSQTAPMPLPVYPNPSMPYQPIQPKSPYGPAYPWEPPYTITCKMEDGSIKTIKTGPIVAQGNT